MFIEHQKDNFKSYIGRGRAFNKLFDYESALKDYNSAYKFFDANNKIKNGGELFFNEDAGFSASFTSNNSYIRDCSNGEGLGYIASTFNCSLGDYNNWGRCLCSELFPDECFNNRCSIDLVCDVNGDPVGDYNGNCCDNGFNWNDYQCSIDFDQGEICDCNNNTFDVCGVCGGDSTSCVGCTDNTACNYNSNVFIDDNSCTYIDDICDTCENGLIIDNDLDDDTVCDDEEVLGCTD